MEENRNIGSLLAQLAALEGQLSELERNYSRRDPPAAAPAGAAPAQGPAAQTAPAAGTIEEIRQLLLRIKEESSASLCEAVIKEKEVTEIKKEVDEARAHIAALENRAQEDGRRRAREGLVGEDLPLTEAEDRAHNRLEEERQEFREHYDHLEKDFETTEKRLMDEIMELKENDARRELDLLKLRGELKLAQEKRQAAESRASSMAIEMMELNVYNKSAAAALKEKDREIADLKAELEKERGSRP